MGQTSVSYDSEVLTQLDHRESKLIQGYEHLVRKIGENKNLLEVAISGVHCAACIQRIESSLIDQQDVSKARLNFSTRRLVIEWVGSSARANKFVQIIESLGYGVSPFDERANISDLEEERFLLLCLGVAGFAMGNIMLLSVGLWTTDIHTMGMATRDFMHWISGLIAFPSVLFAGRPFFRSAFKVLSKGHTNMDVPISLAIVLACAMSLFETINHGEHVYFDSAVMLLFFLLIGRYLDFRARRSARQAATDLLGTLSGFAHVMENGVLRTIPIRDLREGMMVHVAVGQKFPVDGIVAQGCSEIDTSLVTGETLPREVHKGEGVFAGTMNISAPLVICVSKAAEDSLLADIIRLMEKAEQGQAHYVRIADRLARLYTPVVHVMALSAFLFWWGWMGMEWQPALMIAVTVLIITCPCALGLAVPVVQVLAVGRLFKRGILVKSGDALERLSHITTIFLDKTGTLTLGQPVLQEPYSKDHLQLAASLASHSAHPLSRSLSNSYKGQILTLEGVEEFPGQGLQGVFCNKTIKLGNRKWCGVTEESSHLGPELWFLEEGNQPVLFTFSDILREDAKATLDDLKARGLQIYLVSGDRTSVAQSMAREAGIDQMMVYAETTPPQKYALLEKVKKDGKHVLMIGDGLNDAPVLLGADVSIAPSSAMDMAQSAADIVFMGHKFYPIVEAYKTAVFSQVLVKQNFLLAIGYNLVAVPMAFAGMVTPMVAAIAMSGSSIVVIANSFRLKGKI